MRGVNRCGGHRNVLLRGFIDVLGDILATQELAAFLAEVERRAFKQAVFAVRDQHLALDIVQDAMLKLRTSTRAGREPNCRCCFSAFCRIRFATFTAAKRFARCGLHCFPLCNRRRKTKTTIPWNRLKQTGWVEKPMARPTAWNDRKSPASSVKGLSACLPVNARPFCCVTGRNWM